MESPRKVALPVRGRHRSNQRQTPRTGKVGDWQQHDRVGTPRAARVCGLGAAPRAEPIRGLWWCGASRPTVCPARIAPLLGGPHVVCGKRGRGLS
eukprot:3153419-Prymnesium_polylepis.1